jgi:hypothetical protein
MKRCGCGVSSVGDPHEEPLSILELVGYRMIDRFMAYRALEVTRHEWQIQMRTKQLDSLSDIMLLSSVVGQDLLRLCKHVEAPLVGDMKNSSIKDGCI